MYGYIEKRKLSVNVPEASKKAVLEVIDRKKYPTLTTDDLFVIWSSKTMENWKAQLSAPVEGFPLYEVTHNGFKNETYIDVYVKKSNYKLKGDN